MITIVDCFCHNNNKDYIEVGFFPVITVNPYKCQNTFKHVLRYINNNNYKINTQNILIVAFIELFQVTEYYPQCVTIIRHLFGRYLHFLIF